MVQISMISLLILIITNDKIVLRLIRKKRKKLNYHQNIQVEIFPLCRYIHFRGSTLKLTAIHFIKSYRIYAVNTNRSKG